jgi:hypothetical protein
MTNAETRMTNEVPTSNDEGADNATVPCFVIGASSFVRHSDFVIRH